MRCLSFRGIVKCCVRKVSGGVPLLHDSVRVLVACEQVQDVLRGIQPPPLPLRRLHQLEDHRQAGCPAP